MAELSPRDARKIARRAYAMQTLLNLKTMQGAGYLFTLWPLLKTRTDRATAVRVASGFVNSHPIFAAFAQGAMLKRIESGDAKSESDFNLWRESLAGPLGLVGDQLIWDRWKPIVFSLAIIPLLLLPTMTTWIAVAIAILIAYNLPLFRLRVYAVQKGYQLGANVLEALSEPWISDARKLLNRWAVVIAGLVCGVTWAATAGGYWKFSAEFFIAFVVALICTKMQMSIYLSLLLAMLASIGLVSFFN